MRLGGTISPKSRRIAASIPLFALIFQCLYGVLQPMVAYAATASMVSPDALHGWQTTDLTGNGGSVNFVNTIASAGQGSVQFSLPDTHKTQTQSLSLQSYGSTKLADISALSYDTYVYTGSTAAPSLWLSIDKDLTDSDVNSQGYLVYSPYQQSNPVVAGQWQHQNAHDGVWWFSDASNVTCSRITPCSLNTVITLYPHIGISSSGGIDLMVSNNNDISVSNADTVLVNGDSFNFEAISPPQLLSPSNNSTQNSTTLVSSWQTIPAASKYLYESYADESATQLRTSEMTTDTQKTEENMMDGASWWRVKAIDQQGNEGSWSDLWKVTVDRNAPDESVAASGSEISSGGSGQTQELLTQMARLNEPFVVPSSMDEFVAPQVLSNMDTVGGNNPKETQLAPGPVADHGVNTGAAVATESGWKFFGILWYWWLIAVGFGVFLVIRLFSRRPQQAFVYSSDQV